MGLHIRRATSSDSQTLSHICLATGDAGVSAERLHNNPELLGLVYAVPYVHLPNTFGFVLKDDETQEVLGYLLGTLDTLTFEKDLEESWWPPLRQKYRLDSDAEDTQRTEADQRIIKLFHSPDKADKACLEFSPAHFHIDLLPQCQRQGWGRRMIDKAVRYMSEQGLSAVWLGLDPRNDNARRFYEHLGFSSIAGSPDNYVGLRFDNWERPNT